MSLGYVCKGPSLLTVTVVAIWCVIGLLVQRWRRQATGLKASTRWRDPGGGGVGVSADGGCEV